MCQDQGAHSCVLDSRFCLRFLGLVREKGGMDLPPQAKLSVQAEGQPELPGVPGGTEGTFDDVIF